MDEIQHKPTRKQHDGVFADGHLEQAQDFDYDFVDRGNPLTAELTGASAHDKAMEACEAFNRVMLWVWASGTTKSSRIAFRRFIALSIASCPQLFCDQSYNQIGKQTGMGKANISRLVLSLEKEVGLKFRRTHR